MVEWALIAAPIHYGQSDLRDKALMLGDILKQPRGQQWEVERYGRDRRIKVEWCCSRECYLSSTFLHLPDRAAWMLALEWELAQAGQHNCGYNDRHRGQASRIRAAISSAFISLVQSSLFDRPQPSVEPLCSLVIVASGLVNSRYGRSG
jgi:hypothetical protein